MYRVHVHLEMAISGRFLRNFMLLSSLALLNVFVFIYFTNPTLFGLGGEHGHSHEHSHGLVHEHSNGHEHSHNHQHDHHEELRQFEVENVAQSNNEGNNKPGSSEQNNVTSKEELSSVNKTEVVTQVKGKELKRPILAHDFKLVINHPDKCMNPDGTAAEVFLLVLINSIHANFEKRNAIRDTWGSPTMVNGKRVITMFLLAKIHDDKLQALVLQENEKYGDLLMEDFDDTYKNLTLKSIMGFKWANNYCSHAKYGMKTDDDMFVHYENLVKLLQDSPDKKFAVGYLINGAPIRNVKSKWYMPVDIYPGNKYPPFLSGTGYAMSMDVICDSYKMSLETPFLYLEDVFVGICWDKIGVKPVKQKEFFNSKARYSLCRYRKVITSHYMTPTEMYRIWRDMTARKHILCP